MRARHVRAGSDPRPGAALNAGGCLTHLTRRSVGPFRIEDAWTLAALEEAGDPARYLIPLQTAREMIQSRAGAEPGRVAPK